MPDDAFTVVIIASVAALFVGLPLVGLVSYRLASGTPIRWGAVWERLTRFARRGRPPGRRPAATGSPVLVRHEGSHPLSPAASGGPSNRGGAARAPDAAPGPGEAAAHSHRRVGQTRRVTARTADEQGGQPGALSEEAGHAAGGDQLGGRSPVVELDAPSPERPLGTPGGRRLRPVEPPAPVEPFVEGGRVRPVTVGQPARDGRSPGQLPSLGIPSVAIDAVQVEDVAVRAASVRGVGHRSEGVERQDSYRLRRSTGGSWLIVAVADGVSGEACGAAGAAAAVRAGSDLLAEELDRDLSEEPEAVGLMSRVAAAMCEAEADRVEAYGAAALACTLTLAAIPVGASPSRRIWLARVGDSAAAVLDGCWELPFGDGGNSAEGGVYALPLHSARAQTARVELGDGAALVVFSDGIGQPLGDGTGEVGAWLADRWAAPPSGPGFAVDVAFDRATFTDDRTAVGLWPGQAGEPGEDL